MARRRKTSVSPDVYRTFLQNIELEQVMLSSAQVKLSKVPEPGTSLEFLPEETKTSFENLDGKFSAALHLRVRIRAKGDEEPLADIRVAFTGVYTSSEEMTQPVFEIFGDLNLPLNLAPYVREFVHSTTLRMGFPGLVLPTVKRG